jgi:histidinol phosphatase-like PHP family hydrolase
MYPEEIEASTALFFFLASLLPSDDRVSQRGLIPKDLLKIFGDYVTEARRLQQKYKNDITILVGLETEYITDQTLSVREI